MNHSMIAELFLLTTLAGGANAQLTKIDPCALVTKPELQAAIEGKHKADELARLKAKGITWAITTESRTEGEARVCDVHWQGNFGNTMQETGELLVRVYEAEYFTSEVSDLNRTRQRNGKAALASIPGIGDEAHFFGYSETGNPAARVGKVAVGVESLAGKASVDLLKAAVSRVPK